MMMDERIDPTHNEQLKDSQPIIQSSVVISRKIVSDYLTMIDADDKRHVEYALQMIVQATTGASSYGEILEKLPEAFQYLAIHALGLILGEYRAGVIEREYEFNKELNDDG